MFILHELTLYGFSRRAEFLPITTSSLSLSDLRRENGGHYRIILHFLAIASHIPTYDTNSQPLPNSLRYVVCLVFAIPYFSLLSFSCYYLQNVSVLAWVAYAINQEKKLNIHEHCFSSAARCVSLEIVQLCSSSRQIYLSFCLINELNT